MKLHKYRKCYDHNSSSLFQILDNNNSASDVFNLMDLIDFCRVKRERRSVICPLKVCSFTALCVEL